MHALLAAVILAPQTPYADAYEVKEPLRIALTPQLDGKIQDTEWDKLSESGGNPAFLQWEPGVLYGAMRVPAGKELVASLDMAGDGWLVGRDNIELRMKLTGGTIDISARRLDATDRNGPKWEQLSDVSGMVTAAGSLDGDYWNAEFKLLPVDLAQIQLNDKMGIRFDAFGPGDGDAPPFTPRKTALITLQYDRSSTLPSGLEWNPQYTARSVVPGDGIKIRLNFTNPGTAKIKTIAMATEGFGQDNVAASVQPFPPFDNKGRSFVDYQTLVPPGARLGWRVLKAKMVIDNMPDAEVVTSYLISNPIQFDVNLPKDLHSQAGSQIIKGSIYLRSQTSKRVDGTFYLDVPEGWTVTTGNAAKFSIYHSRGSSRIGVTLIAKQGAQGLIPLKLKAVVGDSISERTIFLPIQ